MNNKTVRMIQHILDDCSKHNVELILYPETSLSLSKKIKVSGFWDESDKTIHVAVYGDEWIEVLAHEYSHFCQWKENKFISKEYSNAYIRFDEWLRGEKKISKTNREKYARLIQECELDCEKRAIKFLKKFRLSNEKIYIQKANSYVLGYEAVLQTGKWFEVSPSRIDACWKKLPTTFVKSLKPNKKILNIMVESCF